jgi:hypothetical protein
MALKIQHTTATTNGSTGNQDITISSFGTPQAAIILCSGTASDGTTITTHGQLSACMTDGTNTVFSWTWGNGTSATTRRSYFSDTAVTGESDVRAVWSRQADGNTNGCIAEFVALITDGVRINVTTATDQVRVTVILINGASNALLKTWDTGNTTSQQTVTGVGFQGDFGISLYRGIAFDADSINTTYTFLSLGLHAGSSITGAAMAGYAYQNHGSEFGYPQFSSASWYHYLTQWGFNSDGWTFTTSAAAGGGRDAATLVIECDESVAVGLATVTSAAGSVAVSGLGFVPDQLFLVNSGSQYTGSTVNNYSDSGSYPGFTIGLSHTDSTDSAGHQYMTRYSGTAKALSENGSWALRQSYVDSTALVDPALETSSVSFDADGFTLNFGTSDYADTVYVPYLAIEGAAAADVFLPDTGKIAISTPWRAIGY